MHVNGGRSKWLRGTTSEKGRKHHFNRAPVTSGLPSTPEILIARRQVSRVPRRDIPVGRFAESESFVRRYVSNEAISSQGCAGFRFVADFEGIEPSCSVVCIN